MNAHHHQANAAENEFPIIFRYKNTNCFLVGSSKDGRLLAVVASPQDRNGTALLLEPNANPVARTYQEAVYAAGLPEIVFSVVDVRKEHDRLKKLGVVFRRTPEATDWGVLAVFDDTCGNLIQLYQP